MYEYNVKKRDKYLKKHRDEINKEINDYLKNSKFFLGFGFVLKWYRDHDVKFEDLDYVVDSSEYEKIKNIEKNNSNFQLVLEDWNNDTPVMVKLLYKKIALIDIFFVNKFNGKEYIFVKDPIRFGQNLESDKSDYKFSRESYTTLFLHNNFETQVVKIGEGEYVLPKDMLAHIINIYGNKWNIKLNKNESYEESDRLAIKLENKGRVYFKYKYA